MWNRLRFIRFLQVSQIFQRRKSDANKQDFENKFNLTCHAQSTPKTTGILTKVFSTSGPNLVALAWTGDELSHGQAQNGVNFYFEVKFDLEGQGQSPPKTIGILTKVFYIYSPNLVILADTGHELSRGQARDWRTDGHTHRQTQATTIPEGQYWPRVKIRKVTWNTKILKNMSKDSDSHFLVMFSSSKASRAIEKREGMAHWCWQQFVMTHEMCSTYST